jgi:hypothetical protein
MTAEIVVLCMYMFIHSIQRIGMDGRWLINAGQQDYRSSYITQQFTCFPYYDCFAEAFSFLLFDSQIQQLSSASVVYFAFLAAIMEIRHFC